MTLLTYMYSYKVLLRKFGPKEPVSERKPIIQLINQTSSMLLTIRLLGQNWNHYLVLLKGGFDLDANLISPHFLYCSSTFDQILRYRPLQTQFQSCKYWHIHFCWWGWPCESLLDYITVTICRGYFGQNKVTFMKAASPGSHREISRLPLHFLALISEWSVYMEL